MTIDPQLMSKINAYIKQNKTLATKQAITGPQDMMPQAAPPAPPMGAPMGSPMDPAMMGGAAPMDPSMAGGVPMDPAMMDPAMAGAPMDPAMVDPAMMDPGPDPLEMLKQIARDSAQCKTILATMADQLQIKIPLNQMLQSGEDAIAESSTGGSTGGEKKSSAQKPDVSGYVKLSAGDRDGVSTPEPSNVNDVMRRPLSLDAASQYAALVFAKGR